MADYTSVQTGDWNAAATWDVGGSFPDGADDTAVIADTHVVTLTANVVCGQVTVNSGGTLTIEDAVTLTGMTANMLSNGETIVGAGCSIKWNSASLIMFAGKWTVNGTDGSEVEFANDGAGKLWIHADAAGVGSVFNYANITAYLSDTDHQFGDFIDCDIDFDGNRPAVYVGIYCERCFLHGYTLASRFWFTNINRFWMNIAWGYTRAGVADATGAITSGYGDYVFRVRNIVSQNGSISSNPTAFNAAWAENFGYIVSSMLPGTASDLDNAVVGPGISRYETHAGVIERNTSAKKTGDYGARCAPDSSLSSSYLLEISVYVPVLTGDDITVSVYGRRHTMTNDCAEVEIDPEGAWFTPTTVATTLTNDDTWYEFAPSANTAGGSLDKGMVRIVLRLKEYEAAAYFDWADMVIVCGGTTYNVSMQNWSQGMPVVDEPIGGGAGAKTMLIGGLVRSGI